MTTLIKTNSRHVNLSLVEYGWLPHYWTCDNLVITLTTKNLIRD